MRVVRVALALPFLLAAPAAQAAPSQPMTPAVSTTERAAPPPARGLSVRGQPAGAMAPRSDERPAPQPPAGGQPAAPQPAAPQASDRPESPSSGGDDASARFSLLELD